MTPERERERESWEEGRRQQQEGVGGSRRGWCRRRRDESDPGEMLSKQVCLPQLVRS